MKDSKTIVGTLFDSEKTPCRPDLSEMKIGDFDLYASTFFIYVNMFWDNATIEMNRIDRTLRICIPRYKDDWIDGKKIFDPLTGNFYSFEFFQIALSASAFHLYDGWMRRNVLSSFSRMFKDEFLAISSLFNDLKWVISVLSSEALKTKEINGSYDDFKYLNELGILKATRSFLCKCKSMGDVPLENYTVFSNMTTNSLFNSEFYGCF